ncbi:MAG: hypothetical protein QOC70_513 [Verrucomicrobiota bacterium]|jgi:hypothetical protein
MTHSLHFGQPIVYYLVAGIAIAAFAGLAIVPSQRVSRQRKFEVIFILSACAALFACRWPSFLWPDPFNVDEGTFIACAMKATFDWVPWRGFDASTSGPLNCYVLVLPALLGADIGFFSARVIGLCLIAGALCALYYTVKWIYGSGVARLAIVPPVLLLSLTKTSDFLHYSSEHFSIFLTTVPLAAAAYLARETGSKSSRLIACVTAGLSLGCPVLAKLQASPIALAVLISLGAAIFIAPLRSSKTRRLEILVTGAGLVAVPSIVLISLWATGGFANAVISYYRMALVFMGSRPAAGPSPSFFLGVQDYTFFCVASLAVIVFGGATLYSRVSFTRTFLWASLSSILLLLASLFAIYHGHNPFPHYLLFSIIPVSFCLANMLGLMHRTELGKGRPVLTRSLFVALFLGPLGFAALTSANDFSPQAMVPMREEILAIARYARPGDRMVVWAWRPDYYVKTKTIMATRDPGILALMQWSRYRAYFRERFMSDLRAHPPPVIVDAVAPGSFLFNDRATQGIESFPVLETFVRERYTQREEVAGVRIFVAKNDTLRPN